MPPDLRRRRFLSMLHAPTFTNLCRPALVSVLGYRIKARAPRSPTPTVLVYSSRIPPLSHDREVGTMGLPLFVYSAPQIPRDVFRSGFCPCHEIETTGMIWCRSWFDAQWATETPLPPADILNWIYRRVSHSLVSVWGTAWKDGGKYMFRVIIKVFPALEKTAFPSIVFPWALDTSIMFIREHHFVRSLPCRPDLRSHVLLRLISTIKDEGGDRFGDMWLEQLLRNEDAL